MTTTTPRQGPPQGATKAHTHRVNTALVTLIEPGGL